MALTYTVFKTETLEGSQVRVYQGYEISGVGIILNVILKMTVAGKEIRLFDEEIFVPGATASTFSGMNWTTEDNRDLGMGQTRYVRSFSPSTGGKVIELYRTVKQNITGAFAMVAQEQLYFAAGYAEATSAITPIDITGSVSYSNNASWQDILRYSGGPVLSTSVTLTRLQHLFANFVVSAYSSSGSGFIGEFRIVLDGAEVAWTKQRFRNLNDDEDVGVCGIIRNLSVGSHTLKAQILVTAGEFDALVIHAGTNRGKLEGMLFG